MSPAEDRRRALEAVAYGRAESIAERRSAREALAELRALDAAADPATVPDAEPSPAAITTQDEPASEILPRPPRRRWLVVTIVGAVAVGAVLGAVITATTGGDATASDGTQASSVPSPPLDFSAVGGGGSERMLGVPQGSRDDFPNQKWLKTVDIDPLSTRLLSSDIVGGSLWIGRDVHRSPCLFVTTPGGGVVAFDCVGEDEFAATGLKLSFPGGRVTWNAGGMVIDIPAG
jgi:hypothetical protein